MPLEYTETALEAFILDNLGEGGLNRFRPKVDRLITLYLQYSAIRTWLNNNITTSLGSKEYKENVSILNALMQNIRNLEEDIGLFNEKKAIMAANPLAAKMLKQPGGPQNV